LKDSAILSGGYGPTGTITFTLVAPGGATVDTETVTVSGNGTYTTPTGYMLPTNVAVVGTYQWNATFTDTSGNNFNASDVNDKSEQVPVTKAGPSITTTPSPTSVTLGTSTVTLKDSAILSGGYGPTGTITFTLVAPGGATVDTETVTVSGNGTYTTPTGYTLPTNVAVVGTYQWNATFTDTSGNNFNASDVNDKSEQVPVTKAGPSITTTPSPTSVTLGTSTVTLKDSAILSGGYGPTGTITFTLVAPGGATVDTETVTVSGNGTYTTPTGYTLPTNVAVVGTYQWNATFTDTSGNNFNASDVNDKSEQVPVTKAPPTIVTSPGTTAGLGNITISGTKYLDLTGNGFSSDDTPDPGVTMNLYLEANGSGGLQTGTGGDTLVATTTTTSNGTYSFTVSAAGTYYVQESVPSTDVQTGGGPNGSAGNTYYTVVATDGHAYAGYNFDDFQIPTCQPTCVSYTITHNGCTQTFTSLAGNTHPGDTVTVNFTVPSGMNDQLTLVSYYAQSPSWSDSNANQQLIYQQQTGIFAPGNHSLTVKIPNTDYQIDFICGLAIDQLEPNQNGNAYGPDSGEILYHAEQRYIDSDSGGTTPGTSNTKVPTIPAPTTTVTTTQLLTDSAALSSGYNPGGTITFYLFAPNVTPLADYSNNVYSDVVPVNGNGTYNTSMGNNPGGYVPTATGTYEWIAVYSGDGNNLTVAGKFGDEPETVGPPSITVTKTPDCTQITPGSTAGYTVTITNTGNVPATGLTLSDLLPAGQGNDISWTIDTSGTGLGAGTVPADFKISGSAPNQTLVLSSVLGGTLAAGQSISVHITGATHADDVTSTCNTQCNVSCNFSSTPIPGGDYLWFNGEINASGLCSTQTTTVCYTNQTISFTSGGKSYTVPVPDGKVTFSPTCTTVQTSYDKNTGCWVTVAPCSGVSGNEFLCGLPFLVPAGGLSGGIQNVKWSGTCQTDNNVNVNWKWGAACYTSLTTDCSKIAVKPCDDDHSSSYKDSYSCGTPENFTCYVSCGGTGSGGSDCTGSHGGTCTVTPSNGCGGTGTLTNIATVSANGISPVSASATITITTHITPQVTVTKVADISTVYAGGTAGYTVTLTNTSSTSQATSVTLSDALPAGLGKDINWKIDTTTGNPTDFTITGGVGSQNLTLASGINSLAPGQSISVHITGSTSINDVSSAASTQCNVACNFNSTSIPGGDYLWFNGDVNIQGLCTTQVSTICYSNQTVSFTSGGKSYKVAVPDGKITFSPTCKTAQTVYDPNTGMWVTTMPSSGFSGNQFLCGVPFQVPTGGLPGGIQNVSWSGTCTADSNVKVNWNWGAACYTIFSNDCSTIDIKPCDDSQNSQYKNSDHCGTPENFTCYVACGGTSGGGSDCTGGSHGGSCTVTPSNGCGGSGTLTNIATVGAMCQPSVSDCATITIVSSPISISGTKFNDLTGNGFSCDDPGLGGVTVNLYKDTGDGVLDSADGAPVATTTTASDGTYSFANLMPGTYFVQESVPSGSIQTGGGPNGAAGATYYTVVASGGHSYTGENFDDFKVPTCAPTNVSYTVYNNSCRSTTVSDLRGHTDQGDVVTVTFTVPAGMNDQLTLVSYIAPGPSFDANTAYQQQIYDEATGIFTPGTHTLTVCIPNCDYQIDFVCGLAIDELGGGPGYGPDGSNIFYSAESRLISADNGGTNTCSQSQGCSYGDFTNTSFWSNSNGQSLILKCNNGSNDTKLAGWLGTTFPNLYGAGASCSLVNSNGSYFTNSQVCGAYAHCSSADRETFCTALAVYCTSTNLAGSTATNYAKQCGFNVSAEGCGGDNYNVGSNGAAFGCGNNSTWTVQQLLGMLNNSTNCGNHVSSGGSTACNGINNPPQYTWGWGGWNATIGNESSAYTPAQVRSAYGVDGLSLDGTGQTIAVVDAYDNPNIFESVDAFDQAFGAANGGSSLYDQSGAAASFLTVVGQDGQAADLPTGDITGGWETEEALDIEWIHAMAPGAQIVLVEANSQSLDDLMSAVQTAASLPGVSVVSMSWGFTEGQAALAADEAKYDSYLTTPAGHQGVTFVASTGDHGAADPEYPAFSPNVVAVGGTSLYLNADNSYNSETGWGNASSTLGVPVGGGGGVSLYETEPAFQQGAQSTGYRTTPDVSMVADPATGVWVADTYNLGTDNPWEAVGGTSLSAPSWAALIALADEARVAAGGQTLGSAGPTETQQALYTLPVTDFNAITTGDNGYSAGPGYNLVGGLGTPIVNLLVPDLAAYAGSTAVPAGRIALTAAGATLTDMAFAPANATSDLTNAVVNVEIAGASGGEHFLNGTSGTSTAATSAASANEATLLAADTFDPAATSAGGATGGAEQGAGTSGTSGVVDRLSSTPLSLSSSSPVPSRRLPSRVSSLDGQALDTLFSASGDDRSPFAGDSMLDSKHGEYGWLSDLPTRGHAARPAGTVVGDDVATPTPVACRCSKHTAEPDAPAPVPAGTASAGLFIASVDSTDASSSPAMQESVLEQSDQLIEAVDAVAEKSAEAVSRAYESLVDAVFGLIG
jgi:uncharacterized repeat protein (TIGR01451 family)